MEIKELAKLGGKASAKKRFAGKTKEEISQLMRDVRMKQYEEKRTKKE